MNNSTRRIDNAFLTVIVMLIIISISTVFVHSAEVLVFALVLLTTVLIIYLSIKVDNRNQK